MNNSLTLYEELLLLALKDEEGTILVDFIEYAIAGSILAELLKDQYIQMDQKNKKAILTNKAEPSDSLLLESLQLIKSSSRPKSLKDWTYKIASIKRIKDRVALQLCEKEILKADTDKILFIFNRKIYPEINPIPEKSIMDRLESAIFSDQKEIDEGTMILIALANSVSLLPKLFDKKEIKKNKNRITEIINGELTSKAAKEVIEACQAAILIAAIMPAILASTITTH